VIYSSINELINSVDDLEKDSVEKKRFCCQVRR